MSSTDRPTLDERVMQFNMLQLPGQPMAMHMGTAYLVSDLHKRVKELEGALRESQRCLEEAKRKWATGTTNSDADVAIAKNDKLLADSGEQTTPPCPGCGKLTVPIHDGNVRCDNPVCRLYVAPPETPDE